jgi:hypothetical protein
MEPYRPLVDYHVKQLILGGITEVTPEAKQSISRFLWEDLEIAGETTPFYAAMDRMAFSLVASFKLKKPQIEIAEMKLTHGIPQPEITGGV